MYAVVKKNHADGAEYCEIDKPIIKDNEVLVKVLTTSICGTDLQVYNFNEWAKGRVKLPHVLGHEFAGKIVEKGKNANNFSLDDLVTAETHIWCNNCKQCKTGNKHTCKNTKILGVDVNGSFAKYIAVPAQNLWKLDKNIPLEKACLYEPLGNAVHLVSKENILGKSVIVFGCGPAGLFSIAVAKNAGVKKLVAVDVELYRLYLAKQVGADYVIAGDEEIEEEFDVVFEMSGGQNAIDNCIKVVSGYGVINWFGIPSKKIEMNHSKLIEKGVRTNYIIGREIWNTWYKVESLIEKLNIDPIITHVLKLKDFKKGMELMEKRKCGKIILKP